MKKRRILYVDDDAPLADMVRETLERAGYEVIIDTESKKALKDFAKEPDNYDLAILDNRMPDMDGVELARWLKLNRPDIPLILVTGFPDLLSVEEAKKAGVREVIFKPLTRPELFAAMGRALTSPMTSQEM